MSIPLPVLPPENMQICLTIPDSPEWRQIYMGSMQILAQWWYWQVSDAVDAADVIQRVMECAAITGGDYEGCTTMDCQDFINCLNDPASGTLQAIINSLTTAGYGGFRDGGQNQGGIDLGEFLNPTCDPDILFGSIINVVNGADTNNLDALQVFETVTNSNEFVAEVITGVFGLEAPIVQSLLDWGLFIQNNILENYEAQITTPYLQELYCDLFCLTKDNCELTPEILTNYFYGRLGSQLTFNSLINETLIFLTLGLWTGTEIADVMFLSQFAFRGQFGKWFSDIAFNSIATDFAIGALQPDSSHTILCTDCVFSYSWLGGNGNPIDNGWEIVWGTYESSPEIISQVVTTSPAQLVLFKFEQPLGKASEITQFSVSYDKFTTATRASVVRVYNDLNVIVSQQYVNATGASNNTLTVPDTVTLLDGWRLEFACAVSNLPPSNFVDTLGITVVGSGDDVFA